MPKEKTNGRNGGWIIPRAAGDPPLEGAGRPLGSKNKNSKSKIRFALETEITITNPITKEAQTADAWDHLLIAQMKKAILEGDTAAAAFLLDRLEGKPIQYTKETEETPETQKQFDNLSLDELKEVAKGGKDYTEFEDVETP